MRSLLCVFCLAVASAAPGASAHTNSVCGEREVLVDRLERHFGETRRSTGLAANQKLVELYASEDSGSWTLLLTRPNGHACVLATGAAYDSWESELPATGDPT